MQWKPDSGKEPSVEGSLSEEQRKANSVFIAWAKEQPAGAFPVHQGEALSNERCEHDGWVSSAVCRRRHQPEN